MNGRHWACRVELAFFLPEDVEAVFLLPGEFFHARIDVGLMFAVEVSLRQLGFVNFQQVCNPWLAAYI